jgi:hypothetical protein
MGCLFQDACPSHGTWATAKGTGITIVGNNKNQQRYKYEASDGRLNLKRKRSSSSRGGTCSVAKKMLRTFTWQVYHQIFAHGARSQNLKKISTHRTVGVRYWEKERTARLVDSLPVQGRFDPCRAFQRWSTAPRTVPHRCGIRRYKDAMTRAGVVFQRWSTAPRTVQHRCGTAPRSTAPRCGHHANSAPRNSEDHEQTQQERRSLRDAQRDAT